MNLSKKIILQAFEQKIKTRKEFEKLKQQIFSLYKKIQPPNQSIFKKYRELLKNKQIFPNLFLEKILKTREVRTLSGVAIIAVLTKPFPCPGKCIYCPDDPMMPKSYLPKEPAAARALALKFNPYAQVKKRIEILRANGHKTDKIELIVKGGTWSCYPQKYQGWFIKRCFEAANYQESKKAKKQESKKAKKQESKKSRRPSLSEAQKMNETAANRIVGLTLETRPDFVTPEEIKRLRQLGCTRVELGVQTIDDKILRLVRRGHTAKDVARATALLRDAGFKVDYHLMPALPGATRKKDLENFKKIFSDSRFRPDMIKIYPCSVIPETALYKLWKAGKYKPSQTVELLNLIIKMKCAVPPYVRISRIIRDIPATDIAAGNRVTNLRQKIQQKMRERGLTCQCIRCRETGRQKNAEGRRQNAKLFITKYRASGGIEYFISIEDARREVLFAFLRLRLPKLNTKIVQLLPELKNAAIIRELHTYGHLVPIDKKLFGASQHLGFGKTLMRRAERVAKNAGYKKMAVIAGIGVREYYKKLGYGLEATYMVKNL